MEETVMNQEFANVDLSKVAALQQKRTLAFVNHFVMTNVQFLNSFMKNCEQKLMQFERKLENVNASMVLLEAKLSSIPELDTLSQTIEAKDINKTKVAEQLEEDNNQDTKIETTETESIENKPEILPEYEKFVKMVQVGVPVQAVKLKVSLEGLDPNILEGILCK